MEKTLGQADINAILVLTAAGLWVIFMCFVYWRASKKIAAKAANEEV
jgi:hypothetical protein